MFDDYFAQTSGDSDGSESVVSLARAADILKFLRLGMAAGRVRESLQSAVDQPLSTAAPSRSDDRYEAEMVTSPTGRPPLTATRFIAVADRPVAKATDFPRMSELLGSCLSK